MNQIVKIKYSLLFLILFNLGCKQSPELLWNDLASPQVSKLWVQPNQGKPAKPVWGHANGLQVGLAPMPGPRGLLRIYAPYLVDEGQMINFISIETIPLGMSQRGFSELEMSSLDNQRGKKLWSANSYLDAVPGKEEYPESGVISEEDGVQVLTVFIFVEPFENGAKVYLRLRFYANHPYEVEITTFARNDSKKLGNCIVTATMGNFARLRTLYFAKYTRSAADLWPDYSDNEFAPHAGFSVKDMIHDKNGYAYFIAAPNENNPQNVEYSPDTYIGWKYKGEVATQYWYSPKPDSLLLGLVNGRFVYWASQSPIPGGIAIENFELNEPFKNGAKFVFGVTPVTPKIFINDLGK
jgi:hypothetical protein